MKQTLKLTLSALALLSPMAHAHSVDGGLSNSLLSGITHPFIGIDHLLILLAMGVLSSKYASKKRFELRFPAVILAVMAIGFAVGHMIGAISLMETLIFGSIFVSALAVWQMTSDSLASKALVAVSVAAVSIHGLAHGVEASGGSLISFAAGMLIGSAVIMGLGNLLTKLLSSPKLASLFAGCGFLIGVFG